MGETPDDPEPTPSPNGMWRVWLFVICLIAFIVEAQREAHSPEAAHQRAAAYQHAVTNAADDARQSCTPNEDKAVCDASTQAATEMARRKLRQELLGNQQPLPEPTEPVASAPVNPFNPDYKPSESPFNPGHQIGASPLNPEPPKQAD